MQDFVESLNARLIECGLPTKISYSGEHRRHGYSNEIKDDNGNNSGTPEMEPRRSAHPPTRFFTSADPPTRDTTKNRMIAKAQPVLNCLKKRDKI